MHFAWPLAFLLLPLPLLLRRFAKPAAVPAAGALKLPFYRQLAAGGQSGAGIRPANWPRLIVASLIWLLLVASLARPMLVGPETPLPVEGRDIMMAIDLSGSMGEQDFALDGRATTRLNVVREAAQDFIARRAGDRIGLVLFSDRAYLQAPLTFDREVVATLLNEAQVGLTGQKTAIGDAIAVSAKRLKDRPKDSRVLVLLTDGASNAGAVDPLQAAKLAKDYGIRIYTIGVGAGPMRVQTAFGPQIVNPSAGLDEATLKNIADETGGAYFRARDVEGLAQVYHQIDRLEPVLDKPRMIRPSVALFYWPLGAALVLSFGLGAAITTPWRRRISARSPKTAGA
ncbi:VWA domain-containing protein [Tropicimonas sp. IMCC34043]|uniref:vWA domain-containing protein n=1 Tax=Tropicimonas sp. IMCC34043 TaxID=2248760 RepID=UPI001E3528D5|nr:VWA domain-containing protein [Tropicimonas sp. IMCC34043]